MASRTITLVGSVAAAFGLAVALAGCTGGSAAPAAKASAAPAHDVPTGTELAAALLPATALPAGFTEDGVGKADSGRALSAAAPTVVLGQAGCSDILNAVGQPGFGEASYADDAFTPASALGEFDETLFEFHGSGAAQFVAGLDSALKHCGSFNTSDETGGQEAAKLTLGTAPKLGQSALSFSVWVNIGGAQMVMTDVAVQQGTAVVFVDNSTLATSPDAVDLSTLAGQLLGRLPAMP
ncbi:MAG TPA: hypothetical protein VGX23_24455 [Actinocrinis sp.]|nr:hypothetical protein [Actinocrinis sp.]